MRFYFAIVCVLVWLSFSIAHSQSIKLSVASDTIYTSSDKSEAYCTVTVKNISANLIHVRVDRINEILANGQETYFCWEQCYPPLTSSSS